MTHREVLEAMTGLLAGLFTALLSTTIVATALPTIVGDLKGTQTQYAWVVTVALLSNAASTPIWGKLSDLFNKKLLVQLSLITFVVGSALAGAAAPEQRLLRAERAHQLLQVSLQHLWHPQVTARVVGLAAIDPQDAPAVIDIAGDAQKDLAGA